MRVHKLGPDELKAILKFKNACELMLESERFSFKEVYQKWEDMDDDDPDKQEILALRKRIARDEDMREEYIDGRILAYEYLKRKYTHRFYLCLLTAEILIDNCCDPMETHLAYHPSFQQLNVAPEQ